MRTRGVKPVIARRGVEHGSHLGRERSGEPHLAFMLLGCAVVCQRVLSA